MAVIPPSRALQNVDLNCLATPCSEAPPTCPGTSTTPQIAPQTPRKRKTTRTHRLRGIKQTLPPELSLSSISSRLVSTLRLSYTPDEWQVHIIRRGVNPINRAAFDLTAAISDVNVKVMSCAMLIWRNIKREKTRCSRFSRLNLTLFASSRFSQYLLSYSRSGGMCSSCIVDERDLCFGNVLVSGYV